MRSIKHKIIIYELGSITDKNVRSTEPKRKLPIDSTCISVIPTFFGTGVKKEPTKLKEQKRIQTKENGCKSK